MTCGPSFKTEQKSPSAQLLRQYLVKLSIIFFTKSKIHPKLFQNSPKFLPISHGISEKSPAENFQNLCRNSANTGCHFLYLAKKNINTFIKSSSIHKLWVMNQRSMLSKPNTDCSWIACDGPAYWAKTWRTKFCSADRSPRIPSICWTETCPGRAT